jgi:hypothetical protein
MAKRDEWPVNPHEHPRALEFALKELGLVPGGQDGSKAELVATLEAMLAILDAFSGYLRSVLGVLRPAVPGAREVQVLGKTAPVRPDGPVERILGALRECREDLGKMPTSKEYEEWAVGRAPSRDAVRRWFGKWSRALEAAFPDERFRIRVRRRSGVA